MNPKTRLVVAVQQCVRAGMSQDEIDTIVSETRTIAGQPKQQEDKRLEDRAKDPAAHQRKVSLSGTAHGAGSGRAQ
jgi:hypothetical protein